MERKIYFTICGLTVAGITGIWLLKKWLSGSIIDNAINSSGKLKGVDNWIRIDHVTLRELSVEILQSIGCDRNTAKIVGEHLVESNLQSIDSHGVVRLEQYADQVNSGLFNASENPSVHKTDKGAWIVDGNGGFGITAMKSGVQKAIELIREPDSGGVAVVGVVNCGHTGRLNDFVEQGAKAGALTIICGGGSRKCWRQVAPHGGARGIIPTNPWAMGLPGGKNGPVLIDFATSAMAGGWIMAALQAGATLPRGVILDKNGHPTTNPKDYKAGGALLPAAGPKGYGLGLMAELIGGVMLGKVEIEAGLGLNTLIILVDTERFLPRELLGQGVESVLQEIRSCPPATGFQAVLIPGQWEKANAEKLKKEGILLPEPIWYRIQELAQRLQVSNVPQVEEVIHYNKKN